MAIAVRSVTAGLGGRPEDIVAAAIRAIDGAVFADVEKHLWVTERAPTTVTGKLGGIDFEGFGGLRGHWDVSLRLQFIEAA
jgi:hypothetical protein